MGKSKDSCRQAVVAVIGLIHAGLYLVMFYVHLTGDVPYDNSNEWSRFIMIILCIPEAVTSLFLIKAALEKKAALVIPWLFTTFIMVIITLVYILKVFYSEPTASTSALMIFSLCSMIPVYCIARWFSVSSSSLPPHGASESYPLNNRNNRTTTSPVATVSLNIRSRGTTERYPLTHHESRTTATPVVGRQSAAVNSDTTERYSLRSRYNRPTIPPIAQSAAFSPTTTAFGTTERYPLTHQESRTTASAVVERQSTAVSRSTTERNSLSSRHSRPTAAVNFNTTGNITDEPPAYDEAVAKVPYHSYPVAGPVATGNLPYPVSRPVAAPNLPYPITDPVGIPNLPYPVADSVAAPNPPYPIGDPVGAPKPHHRSVEGSTDVPIVGWRTDLLPDNPKM